VGSYLSYQAQTSAEAESRAFRTYNYLILIRADLQRQQYVIEKGEICDKVFLSKLLNWEGMKKETQDKIRKEFFGRSFGKLMSSRILNMAMSDYTFYEINTQLFLILDHLYANILDINNSIEYINRLAYNIYTFNLSEPDPNIESFRNVALDLDKRVDSMNAILTDCLNEIEIEIKRFSRKASIYQGKSS
jgi:hypothetical protein